MSQHRRILDAIDTASTRDAIVLDTHQRQMADRLAALPVQPTRRTVRRPQGLYIHGPAGGGKSWLANAFFDAVPTPQKTRVHFHEFFDDLHRRIHNHHHETQALPRAIDEATAHSRLLLFDELHVHDSGNARLLTQVLEHLVQRKTIVVVTSNYEPDPLLPNPIWHHTLEPGIALIKKHFDIVHLCGKHGLSKHSTRRLQPSVTAQGRR